MNNYYIKVGKIDYFTWKAGAIVLLILCLLMIYLHNNPNKAEINDNYWHMGYADCERNYNFTSDEIMIINQYRVFKLENKTIEIIGK